MCIRDRCKSDLKKRFESFELKFKNKEVPRPKNWNGYCIYPDCFEFWFDGDGRLHDRVEYKLKSGKWITKLLYP